MNPAQLLRHFDRIAEAPDAVARLRRFILDLAVRGKLVEQDPNDEPAAELLKRINVEKARLAEEGVIRKPKPSAPIQPDELPIEIPTGWVWIRLCDFGTLSGGLTPSKNRSDYWDGDIVWLSPKDIKADEISDSELKITSAGLSETRLELYPPGSLFMVARSGILKRTFPVTINRVQAASNQDLKVLVPYLHGSERYLQIMFRGLTEFILRDLVKTGTTVQSLKYAEFQVQPFPIPPLAEQHLIVAKVDELMALCDRLEAAQSKREQRRDRLVAASLNRINQPAPSTDGETATVFRERARFHLDHLPRLTTRPEHIKSLRQTILNLAVRGRLVPQDPDDEPASELSKRLVRERKQLVAHRQIRGAKPPPPPEPEKEPLHIPPSWQLCSLGQIAIITDPNPSHRYPDYSGGTVPILSTREFSGDTDWNPEAAKLTTEAFWEFQKQICDFADGDLIFARKGRLGLPRYLPKLDRFTFSHTLFVIKPMKGLDPAYLLWLLRRDEVVDWLTNEMNQNTGVPTLGKAKTERLPIPLPPLAEQHRIVAKVDELMAVCDQLEAQLTATRTDSRRLLEAVLHQALVPAAKQELTA